MWLLIDLHFLKRKQDLVPLFNLTMAARKIFSDSYLEAQQNLKTLFLRSDTHLNTKKGIYAKIAEILNSGIIKLAQTPLLHSVNLFQKLFPTFY